ncbi:THAP domain-containing protein 2 [Cyphomyrmex costatus]|uniref:THAP domain-containing protein 2 n=1 Tax=Cyphomyrmex costatus TaxID=456900 RepID=A0A151IB47_9HYME|nr:THAP domain-containing protein 2 [Cyphomyrmex costatus]
MSACVVKGCKNSYRKMKGKTVKFFRFPKDEKIAAKWRKVCRNEVNMNYGRICSDHFEVLCYDKSAQQIALQYSPIRSRKLRFDAIPTINLFEEPHVVEGVGKYFFLTRVRNVPYTATLLRAVNSQ